MEPLLLHHHLAKNAGTSLRQVIQANYGPGELYENYELSPWMDARQWWADWYASLGTDDRARLRCVGGHTASALFDAVEDRPVRALCVLRDPVDRVTSLYRYSARQLSWPGRSGKPASRDRLAQAILSRGWTLGDIYRELGERPASEVPPEFLLFFNGQARELLGRRRKAPVASLSTGVEALGRDREEVLRALSRGYVVGTQDRLSESIRLFADTFGWRRVFLPRLNVSANGPPPPDTDAETRELIRAYNALDVELHAHFSDGLRRLPQITRWSRGRWRVRRGLRRAPSRVRRRLRSPLRRAASRD